MTDQPGARVLVLHAELFFPEAHSLKEKRMELRRLKDRLHAHYNVSVAEVGYQDLWQRALVAVAAVSGERAQLEQLARRLVDEMERLIPGALTHFDMDLS